MRLLRPGAALFRNGKSFGTVENWFDEAVRIGPAVQALEQIAGLLKFDLNDVFLSDLTREEFVYALSFLDGFVLRHIAVESFVPGFLFGSSKDRPLTDNALTDLGREPVLVKLPIVLNLKSKGLIIWVVARGTAFIDAGRWCGLRLNEQLSWSFEVTSPFEKSLYPEAWVSRHLPALLVGPPREAGVDAFQTHDADYFKVEAKIVKDQRADPKGKRILKARDERDSLGGPGARR